MQNYKPELMDAGEDICSGYDKRRRKRAALRPTTFALIPATCSAQSMIDNLILQCMYHWHNGTWYVLCQLYVYVGTIVTACKSRFIQLGTTMEDTGSHAMQQRC